MATATVLLIFVSQKEHWALERLLVLQSSHRIKLVNIVESPNCCVCGLRHFFCRFLCEVAKTFRSPQPHILVTLLSRRTEVTQEEATCDPQPKSDDATMQCAA